MLAVFQNSLASAPEELYALGGNTSPGAARCDSSALFESFENLNPNTISLKIKDVCTMSYAREKRDLTKPRLFGAKDDIFCVFEGALENLPSLRQQYGLSKTVNEVILIIEAYKTLRDRAPYPASHVVGHLSGHFAFVLLDRATGTVFAAKDSNGKIPLFWGITADGSLAFSDNAELLNLSCGKSLASFPQGCLFLSNLGLRSYENPRDKVKAVPTMEEEICGAKFQVERESISAGSF
eukprot:TRINITY_DN6000_c0_g1_i1.p1 TRINITY_DN6000_c0_g1~~TRINITY_DN6000_c0_g1_i1.p1  ORF type:complete len:238 (+),score=9.69 TRINITY_DN6000_c0_g1_i1:193-906(+)